MLLPSSECQRPKEETGPGLEGIGFSADPCSKGSLLEEEEKGETDRQTKGTVQLSKPVHGLTETGVHAFVQAVSCVFWNEKGEIVQREYAMKDNRSFVKHFY